MPLASRREPPRNSLVINGETSNLVATGCSITWHSPKVPKSHKPSKSVEQIRGYTWEAARQQLIRLLREQAVQYGLTTLASGTMTDVFVDTSRVMLLCPGLSLIESLLRPLLAHDHVDAVGGPAVGAVPLVTLMARH